MSVSVLVGSLVLLVVVPIMLACLWVRLYPSLRRFALRHFAWVYTPKPGYVYQSKNSPKVLYIVLRIDAKYVEIRVDADSYDYDVTFTKRFWQRRVFKKGMRIV